MLFRSRDELSGLAERARQGEEHARTLQAEMEKKQRELELAWQQRDEAHAETRAVREENERYRQAAEQAVGAQGTAGGTAAPRNPFKLKSSARVD